MISETTFLDCENISIEMSSRFDQPWTFVGEVKKEVNYLKARCEKCNRYHNPVEINFNSITAINDVITTVMLKSYLFITDDKLEVIIFFGVCEKCDTVHWARQEPPFKRARSYI